MTMAQRQKLIKIAAGLAVATAVGVMVVNTISDDGGGGNRIIELRPGKDVCGALDELELPADRVLCTHGPDDPPPGVDITVDTPPVTGLNPLPSPPSGGAAEGSRAPEGGAAAAPGPSYSGQVPCYGGADGPRVQAVYARRQGADNRYDRYLASFRQWAAEADYMFAASAGHHGGVRHLRWVTDARCELVVESVEMSPGAMGDFGAMASELVDLGLNRPDRKYLVWADTNVYCGIGALWHDENPGRENLHNGNRQVPGMLARVDSGCWGKAADDISLEAHELLHTLGAVGLAAPNTNSNGHCLDDGDLMCYDDGAGPTHQVCDPKYEPFLDCNGDDYFNPNPRPRSYLDQAWNTADSDFLASQEPPR